MQATVDLGPGMEVRARGGTQLALTILACFLSVGAYLLVAFGKTGRSPAGVGGFVATIVVAYLLTHVLTTWLAPGADPVLFPAAAVLAGLGYAMIFRLDSSLAGEQLAWILVGLGAFAVTLLIVRDHRSLDAYTYTIGLLGLGFLLLPIAPAVGETINGARLWIHFGPIRFQPSEIAKVMIVIFLASYLAARKELLAVATRRVGPVRLPEPRYLGPLFVAWVVSLVVLFIEKDLGSSLLFFGIFVVMLYVATARIGYVAAGFGLFLVGAIGVWRITPHVRDRVTIWLHPWTDHKVYCPISGHLDLRQNCLSFQLVKSLYSIGHGEYAGTGLGKGTFATVSGKQIIPDLNTDFIYSALAQELGLIGAAALLLVYMIFVLRGMRIALLAQDGFSKLAAAGLTFGFALQTFIIVGGILRLIPLTGITLPFVSYGGSSLVANFVLLALLIRVSAPPPRHAPLPTPRGAT